MNEKIKKTEPDINIWLHDTKIIYTKLVDELVFLNKTKSEIEAQQKMLNETKGDIENRMSELFGIPEKLKNAMNYVEKYFKAKQYKNDYVDEFMVKLNKLCKTIIEVDADHVMGRPRHSKKDIIFSIALQSYLHISTRAMIPYLAEAQNKGYISKILSHNSLCRYHLDDTELIPDIINLIALCDTKTEISFISSILQPTKPDINLLINQLCLSISQSIKTDEQ